MNQQTQLFSVTVLVAAAVSLTSALLYSLVLCSRVFVAVALLSLGAVLVAAIIDIYHGHGMEW